MKCPFFPLLKEAAQLDKHFPNIKDSVCTKLLLEPSLTRDILQSTLHVSSHTSAFPQLWFVLVWEACKMQYPKDLSNWLSQDTL